MLNSFCLLETQTSDFLLSIKFIQNQLHEQEFWLMLVVFGLGLIEERNLPLFHLI